MQGLCWSPQCLLLALAMLGALERSEKSYRLAWGLSGHLGGAPRTSCS